MKSSFTLILLKMNQSSKRSEYVSKKAHVPYGLISEGVLYIETPE